MSFKLTSEYNPTGDQPKAIKQLTNGINIREPYQVLLGVTGSGKTFTMANVIANINKPTLVISHNKTLAAQLYQEFKGFFPQNSIEYFVSYYDYYQPESYLPTTDTYIEKDLSINKEIEKLRLSTTSTLASKAKDIVVVSSVSCIYGLGNPENFSKSVIILKKGTSLSQRKLLFNLVDLLYQRTNKQLIRSTFRVSGDTVDIFPAYTDFAFRILFWGDQVDEIHKINPFSGEILNQEEFVYLYPASIFIPNKSDLNSILNEIKDDLSKQANFFDSRGYHLEAQRLQDRINLDIEMIRELGYCSGIENYSKYFDRRETGQRPFCLFDYFPNDYLLIIDESHVTIPQIKAMYGGDKARKMNLVQHGFRLPSAMDNRPLTFEEFETLVNQVIFVSATPSEYELEKSQGVIVEQIIRPTGLLDPKIEVRPSLNQIDDVINEIHSTMNENNRILITTLTKRMAEEVTKYLKNLNIKCSYIHSEIKTLERIDIINDLKDGTIDVLIGVNLLREGIDLPEVSLVIIFDADKEGFLRNSKSLIQTIGRAARNKKGRVIMYADTVTKSMQEAIDETLRRRKLQMDYNLHHNVTPKSIKKIKYSDFKFREKSKFSIQKVSDKDFDYLTKKEIEQKIKTLEKKMKEFATNHEYLLAAEVRNQIVDIKKKYL